MLWEHEPSASVSLAYSSSPKLSRVKKTMPRNNFSLATGMVSDEETIT